MSDVLTNTETDGRTDGRTKDGRQADVRATSIGVRCGVLRAVGRWRRGCVAVAGQSMTVCRRSISGLLSPSPRRRRTRIVIISRATATAAWRRSDRLSTPPYMFAACKTTTSAAVRNDVDTADKRLQAQAPVIGWWKRCCHIGILLSSREILSILKCSCVSFRKKTG